MYLSKHLVVYLKYVQFFICQVIPQENFKSLIKWMITFGFNSKSLENTRATEYSETDTYAPYPDLTNVNI